MVAKYTVFLAHYEDEGEITKWWPTFDNSIGGQLSDHEVRAKDADAFNGELFCRCSAVSAGAVQVSVSLHALQCSTGGERVTACTAVQGSCDGQLITRRGAARGNYCSLHNEGWARGYPDIEMGRTLLKWHFWTRAPSCVPKQIEF